MRWNLRSPMREKSNRIYLWFTLYHQIQSHHANKCEFRCCVLSINGVASKNNIVSCNYRLRVTCNSTQCECGLDKRGKAETKSNKNNNIKIMKPNSFSRTRTSAVSLVLFGWHIWIRISASHSADAWASYACLLSLSPPIHAYILRYKNHMKFQFNTKIQIEPFLFKYVLMFAP